MCQHKTDILKTMKETFSTSFLRKTYFNITFIVQADESSLMHQCITLLCTMGHKNIAGTSNVDQSSTKYETCICRSEDYHYGRSYSLYVQERVWLLPPSQSLVVTNTIRLSRKCEAKTYIIYYSNVLHLNPLPSTTICHFTKIVIVYIQIYSLVGRSTLNLFDLENKSSLTFISTRSVFLLTTKFDKLENIEIYLD